MVRYRLEFFSPRNIFGNKVIKNFAGALVRCFARHTAEAFGSVPVLARFVNRHPIKLYPIR